MEITEEIKKVAIMLCKQDRYASDSRIEVAPGFQVPYWLAYVSRATQLVMERQALT